MSHENIYYLLPLVYTCEYVYIYPRVSGIRGFGFGDGFPPESVSGFDFGFRFWMYGDSTRSEPDPLSFLLKAHRPDERRDGFLSELQTQILERHLREETRRKTKHHEVTEVSPTTMLQYGTFAESWIHKDKKKKAIHMVRNGNNKNFCWCA